MSTRTGLRTPVPAPRDTLTKAQKKSWRYRCVWCERTYSDVKQLMAHEGSCDARFVMKRMWARQLAEAYARDKREGRG